MINTIKQIKARKADITSQISTLQNEIKKLDKALKALAPLVGTQKPAKKTPKKRTISPAHRRAVSKAQKARWAKIKAEKAKTAKAAK